MDLARRVMGGNKKKYPYNSYLDRGEKNNEAFIINYL